MVTPTLMCGRKYQQGINTITTVAMTAFHVLAVAAFFFIDWGAIATAVVLYFAAGMLGIGMAYHRLLTHRSYKTTKWVEYFLTWCGTLALEGGPIFWVATHRVHHQKSDLEGDPHTPREGTWARTWDGSSRAAACIMTPQCCRSTRPIVPRPRSSGSKWHWTSNVVVGLILLAVGGVPYVLWGIFFRTTVGLHATWLVNSATHKWGPAASRPGTIRRTTVGRCLTFGEGWHNNHHAHPTSARPPGLRDRPELDGHQHLEGARAGVGHQAGEDQAAAARRNARRAGGGSSRVRSLHDPSPEGDRLLHHALRPARRRGDPAQRLLGRLHRNAGRLLIVGILLFALIIAGIIVYTVFLVMETSAMKTTTPSSTPSRTN